MNELWSGVVTILTAIVGVAILAVIVSKNANTSGVISAGGNAFATGHWCCCVTYHWWVFPGAGWVRQ